MLREKPSMDATFHILSRLSYHELHRLPPSKRKLFWHLVFYTIIIWIEIFCQFCPQLAMWKDTFYPLWPLGCIVRDVKTSLNTPFSSLFHTFASISFVTCMKFAQVPMCTWVRFTWFFICKLLPHFSKVSKLSFPPLLLFSFHSHDMGIFHFQPLFWE